MLAFLLPLSLVSLIHCRVTFDGTELIDKSDLKHSTTTPFPCSKGCSVYSPSHTPFVKVIDEKGFELISLANISSSADTKGFALSPGNYALKKFDYDYDFTFYVVQKDAANFDVPVYTLYGKVGVANRYVTFLTEMPGFRIKNINGDLSKNAVRVYTTGAQALGTGHCKPVYTSRSGDNAARSTLNILGPIATIDFGSADSMHYATFAGDYTTIYTDVGTSSIYVTPGYVGCGDGQVYANDYITKIEQKFNTQKNGGMCVQVYADYAISSVSSSLSIGVNQEHFNLTDTGVLNQRYDGTNFDISLLWNKQGDSDSSQFAVQIDLLAKAECAAKL